METLVGPENQKNMVYIMEISEIKQGLSNS